MAFEEIQYRNSILLPSNMNVAEFEAKIFKQPVAPTAIKAKTYDDVLYLLGMHQGVHSAVLMNRQGRMVRSHKDPSIGGMYCGICKQILDVMTPTIEDAGPVPERITVVRINSVSQEVSIAPIPGEDLVFVIVQNLEDRPSVAQCTKGGDEYPSGAKESRLLQARMESPSLKVSLKVFATKSGPNMSLARPAKK